MSNAKDITLLIMAAGMGSRYGGMKQIDHVDDEGDKIIDFSIYDAIQAGFTKVVFVIKEENLDVFREEIGDRVSGHIKVEYAFQRLEDIPSGCLVPEGRVKPWGTAHAVLSAKDVIDGPFAVINADDFYGRDAFKQAYDFLSAAAPGHYAMVGYELRNTLTENGTVSRGICRVSEDELLEEVVERTKIRGTNRVAGDNGAAETEFGDSKKTGTAAVTAAVTADAEYTLDDGKTWVSLAGDSATSMNFWCFASDFMDGIGEHFERFMREEVPLNPEKAECYLPTVVSELLAAGKCDVKVLHTSEKWHGVTYKEDKPGLVESIREMKEAGLYPKMLWG
ncbi:MAG: nucleotidyltransferase [Lachnospiraceae bacterium]|nr:nucleotidyltransferase [Lachnospiraceae bacterium]